MELQAPVGCVVRTPTLPTAPRFIHRLPRLRAGPVSAEAGVLSPSPLLSLLRRYDGFGYGVRGATGEKVHQGIRGPFGCPVREGDVVGLYISLPDTGGAPPPAREVVKWKGTHGAFYADPVEAEAKVLPGAPPPPLLPPATRTPPSSSSGITHLRPTQMRSE